VGLLLGCYIAMTALWFGVGEAVVHFTPGTTLGNADQNIEEWFVERRTPRLNTLSLIGSMLAETAIKIAITAIVCAVLLWIFHRWFESLVIAVSLILEAMVFLTVTLLVKRPRPDVPRLDGSPVSSSFPSGHVAAAVCYAAMAVVVFWHTRKRWIRVVTVVLVVLVPIAVALARMYRGMHHLTDVVAGAMIGAMSVVLVTTILSRAEERRLASTGASGSTRSIDAVSESTELESNVPESNVPESPVFAPPATASPEKTSIGGVR
jgi:membrane-associated phospholipid phosphatase